MGVYEGIEFGFQPADAAIAAAAAQAAMLRSQIELISGGRSPFLLYFRAEYGK